MKSKTIVEMFREKAAPRNGHARAAEPPDAPQRPDTFTADALMRMQLPAPRWAVGGIAPEGLSILAGKPKLGKSWLALHLSLAVSAGGVALGRIVVEGGSVLYVSLEDTKRRLQARIRKLLGPGEQPSPRLHLAHDWPRLDRGGGDAVAEWVEAHPDARLVILDTWAKFRPVRMGRGDNYDLDYADGALVKAVADRRGVSVVIVHHCRKLAASDAVEEVAGSVGLTGACDGILVMRRERGQHDATLTVTGRDVDEAELALSFDKQRCLWQLMGDADDYRLSKERAEVLNVLRKAGRPLTPAEAGPLLGKTTNAAKQLLWKMAHDGQIEAIGAGHYAILRKHDNPTNRSNPDNGSNHDNRPGEGGVTGGEGEDNRDETLETPWG